MIDKLKFPKDVEEITELPAALLITCPTIGDCTVAIVESMAAAESSRVIYCAAIPKYSIPYAIVSEREPAFAFEVTQVLARLMGIPE